MLHLRSWMRFAASAIVDQVTLTDRKTKCSKKMQSPQSDVRELIELIRAVENDVTMMATAALACSSIRSARTRLRF